MFWMICVLFSVAAAAASEVIVNANNDNLTCVTDRDCPITSFCYRTSCIDCVNCAKKNRQDAPLRCARRFDECGPCLSGFINADAFRPKSRCILINAIAEPQLATESDIKTINSGWFGLAAVCLISLLGFVSYRCYNQRRNVVVTNAWNHELGSRSDIASPPPPYHEEHMSDSGSVSYSFQLRVTEHPSNDNKMAVPFQPPMYYEGSRGTIAFSPPIYDNESVEQTDNIVNNAVDDADEYDSAGTNVDIHDENTQPSNWTPGSSYNETDEVDNAEDTKVSPPVKKRKIDKEIESSKES